MLTAKSTCTVLSARARAGTLRARVIVRAEEPRTFNLNKSTQAAEGFVEKDTAGQSNMYPTYTRPFEAGSSSDTVNQDNFNNTLAAGASALALGAIGVGLTVLVNGTTQSGSSEDFSQYLTLTQYSAEFSQELAPKPAPVAVVEAVVEAPAVVEAAAEAPAVASE